MPEMSKAYTPEHMGDIKPRKKILKLGRKITDCFGHKLKGLTVNDPEYWGLACILTDEMCDVALKMDVRKLYTLDEMVSLTKKPKEQLEPLLTEMSNIGILEYNYGDLYDDNGPIEGDHQRRYLLPMFVPGSAEFTNMIKKQLDDHPELAMFFERMTFLPLAGITEMVPPGGAGIGMHVIPVEKAIEMENESLSIEHISHWLKKYDGHISAGICSCRYGRAKLGEGCGDSAEEWCIGVGDMADYCVETNKGHYITTDEALNILENAEKNGFVHQITNIDGTGKIFAICNCNLNICNALRTSQLFNTPNLSRSAYTAKVDPGNCVACGKCVESCPAGAVKLGQKLCTKDGPICYPKHVLPDYMPWGEDMWDEDYRDHNRINCYDTGTAPCKTACPAHIAIQGYLQLANEGRYKEALELIKKDNPFPAVCGRICNKRCEDACTRGTIDKPVAIDSIKRFIAEQDLKKRTRFLPEKVIPSNLGGFKEKIAIIGAGPAGLACAYFLALKGYNPTVFEKNEKPGGMMVYGIPSYKLDKSLIDAEIEIIKELGVEIKCGIEVGKDITIKELKKKGFKAFYLAIGLQGGKRPNIPNDDAKGTYIAVDFLRDVNEKKYRKLNGNVVVVGGGNVAMDCARSAARLNANKVTCISLESRKTMPASKEEISDALNDNVEIINGYGPKEILLENGKVNKIIFKKCLSTINEDGKFDPQYDEDRTITIDVDYLIYAIGQDVVLGNLLKGSDVKFHHGNYPIADKLTQQTDDPCIFVGGDVYTGAKFVIDAIAQGRNAADSLHRFVQPGSSLTIGKDRREFIELDKNNIDVKEYDISARQYGGIDDEKIKKSLFVDPTLTLTEKQVKIETSRCLKCGASIVDENKCIGCGICTTKCKFDAIHLYRDHPECSNLIKSEDKFKAIIPYMAKRAIKIKFKKKTKEEKAIIAKHKEAKKAMKANKNA